jgi:hypothetical protein
MTGRATSTARCSPRPAARAGALEVLQVVGRGLAERLPGSLVSQVGDAVTAAVPTDALPDPLASLRSVIADVRRRVDQLAPGLMLSVGIGAPARTSREFADSHRDARQIELLRTLNRGGETIARDELEILGPLRRQQAPRGARHARASGAGTGAQARRGEERRAAADPEAYLDCSCDARACAEALYVQ